MGSRQELQTLLKTYLQTNNVYFQPPPNLQMSYPAAVYEHDLTATEYANNKPYLNKKRYQLTIITDKPDSEMSDKVSWLPLSAFVRHFVQANLHHYVYSLYF